MKRILSIFLCFSMLLTLFGTQVFASETQDISDAFVVTYGDGSKSFSASELGGVDEYLIENSITEATLKLNANISAEQWTDDLTVPVGVTLTLDLNGHTMQTETKLSADAATGVGIKMSGSGSKIIIDDTSGTAQGTIKTKYNSILVSANGTTTSYVEITIKNCTVISETQYAVSTNAKRYVKIDTENATLKNEGDNATVIDAASRNSEVELRPGTYIETQGTSSYVLKAGVTNANVVVQDGVTIISAYAPIFDVKKIEINGGVFKVTNSALMRNAMTSATINGGKFYSTTTDVEEALPVYSSDKWTYPEGMYVGYNESEGCFTLIKKPTLSDSGSLKIGGTNYTSVLDAFSAVKDGETIVLMADSELVNSESIPVTANITIDLNGKKLNIVPFQTTVTAGTLNVSAGSLTVKDSVGGGELAFGDETKYGVTLGMQSGFTLDSGKISGAQMTIVMSQVMYQGTIKVNAGEIVPTVNGTGIVCGATLNNAMTSGKILVAGGEITARGTGHGINSTIVPVEITGGMITAENGCAVQLHNTVTGSKSIIAGNVELSATGNYVVYVTGGGEYVIGGNARIYYIGNNNYAAVSAADSKTILTIEDDAIVDGRVWSIHNLNKGDNFATVNLNGGHYKYETTPFYSSARVTYKTDDTYTGSEEKYGYYVLSSVANTTGDYVGYYDLVTRTSLNWEDTTTTPATAKDYQDFEELNYTIASANAALENKSVYTQDTVDAVEAALTAATEALTNVNANQAEINYLKEQLDTAVANLTGVSELDPTSLADGKYQVEITTRKFGTTSASMMSGAIDSAATLIVENGEATLQVSFHPTNVLSLWGHLTKLWIFNGESATENRSSAKSWNGNSATRYDYMSDSAVLNYYTVDDSAPSEVIPCETGHEHDSNCYPYVVMIPLNYIDTGDGGNIYALRVSVDQMINTGVGDQNVDLYVKWGTLTVVELKPTLKLDSYNADLILGVTGHNKATITATLQNAEGYTVSWSSDNEDIAIVNSNGVVTAVAAGECTVTCTATNGTNTITKTVAVKVMGGNSDTAPVEVDGVTVNGSEATANLAGNALVNNTANGITLDGDTVNVNAKSETSGITSAKVVIPAATADALNGKTVIVETNVGSIKLDAALVAQMAAADKENVLTIAQATNPNETLYTAAYELTLTAGGKAVDFGTGTATVKVACDNSEVLYSYCLVDGKRTERLPVTVSEGTASWTVSHFSVWALSTRDLTTPETDGDNTDGKFFLADGTYYVDIDLWKASSDEQSMGAIAFANNNKALVTVANGKITKVQIASNPVDVGTYHSAIITFKVDGVAVTVLETGELVTKPANETYDYIKRAEFTMPDEYQPVDSNEITYVPVQFWVPDTPMDAAVGDVLEARLKFIWSTAVSTEEDDLDSDDNTASDSIDVVLKDDATGITIDTSSDYLDVKATISVEKITSGDNFDLASSAMEGIENWTLYKVVTLVDGVETAPKGAVKVMIPCDADGLTVYRINASGTKTLLNGTVENGYYIINTSSLGLFAIVEADVADNNGNNDNQGGENGNGGNNNTDVNSPQTGDTSNMGLWFALMIASLGAMLVTLKLGFKRKSVTGE